MPRFAQLRQSPAVFLGMTYERKQIRGIGEQIIRIAPQEPVRLLVDRTVDVQRVAGPCGNDVARGRSPVGGGYAVRRTGFITGH